jgi:hypothetical protein
MSYQVSLDQDEPIQLASNQGYYDYCDWIESLDPDEYPKLDYLNEEGCNQPAGEVADELERALESDPPDEFVASTAKGLIAFIRKGDPDAAVVIGQGVDGAEPEDDGEPADDEEDDES